MHLFRNIQPAVFLARPNRFVVQCLVSGRKTRAYLPNPGRLWELFFPGAKLYVVPVLPSAQRKLAYLVAAVERDGLPVMLHTHANNLVARRLIEEGLVPGLEGAEVVRQEYRTGQSRFDFLLQKDRREIVLEVKSCTLFNRTLAMFPDAVSARATRHLLELVELSRRGRGTAVLFVVHSPMVRYFMPEHHTDLELSRALLAAKDRVLVKAVSIGWNADLTLGESVRELTIPWDLVERESHDRGSYLVILKLARGRAISIGGLGDVKFRKGYYLYAGSAKKDLTKRIDRHRRSIKNLHWHIDHLREHAEFVAAIPIRSSADQECDIAAALADRADWQVPGFGCSDCSCTSHLFGLQQDPFLSRAFIALLLHFRMDLLEQELARRELPR